jgi:pyridoxine 5'-phosphate synthase PdxJ
MSHTVTTKSVRVKNADILEKAVKALQAKGIEVSLPNDTTHKSVKLYASQHAGIAVKLDGWNYPVVIDTTKGELYYDNYNGSWGKQEKLDELLQEYVKQEAIDVYASQGFMVDEFNTKYLENGDLELHLKAHSWE